MNPEKAEKVASAIIQRLFPSASYQVEVEGLMFEWTDLDAQYSYIVDLLTGEEELPTEED